MKRLIFWTLVAALALDIAWMVALSNSPEATEHGWTPLISTPNYGFAGFIAMLVGAVIQPRGLVWIIALGSCVLGAVIWLLTAIDLPTEDIRWANAVAFAVSAVAGAGAEVDVASWPGSDTLTGSGG